MYAFTRRLGDAQLLVLGNFSAEPARAEIADAPAWDTAGFLLGNLPDPPSNPATTPLRPWESRLLRRP